MVLAPNALHTQMPATLTPKQELFVNEYLVDWNGTQAAIRAGYSERTAQEQASRLLTNEAIKRAVEASRQKVMDKVAVTVEKVLADLEEVRLKALEAKQFSPAVRASELQGKYLKMFFDGHTVDPTGVGAMSEEQLLVELRRVLGPGKVEGL